MAWNGSGTFTRTNGDNTGSTTWQQDKADDDFVTASRHDSHDQDLADGINACLAKNGENAMTGDLDFGDNNLSNINQVQGSVTCTGAWTFSSSLTAGDIDGVSTITTDGGGLTIDGILTITAPTIISGQSQMTDNVNITADLRVSSPTVPSTASDTGSAGTLSWDSDYIYVCTATNTWKRAALTTW